MRLVGDTDFRKSCPPPDARRMPVEPDPASAPVEAWPREVDLILSAMEAAASEAGKETPVDADRRSGKRAVYRTRAELRLFAHDPLAGATPLFTRDVQRGGIGFITQEHLPLGYAGIVELTLENGRHLVAHCQVSRCRETVNGWFEGALQFTQEQSLD